MTFKPNEDAGRRAILEWAKGDQDAADFLVQMAEIARLADDIVDEDVNRQRNACWLLSRCLSRLPLNPFFAKNAASLAPLVNMIIIYWEKSDEWRRSGDRQKQTFGFVMREGIQMLATSVGFIVGGYEHAKFVAGEVFELCLSGSDETVDSWIGE